MRERFLHAFQWISLAAALSFVVAVAWPAQVRADALDDAKAAGLVGERYDGYLGYPRSPSDGTKALVKEINNKRRAAYGEIAKKRGTSVDAVAKITASEVFERLADGQYYLPDPDAGWQRK